MVHVQKKQNHHLSRLPWSAFKKNKSNSWNSQLEIQARNYSLRLSAGHRQAASSLLAFLSFVCPAVPNSEFFIFFLPLAMWQMKARKLSSQEKNRQNCQ